MKKLLYLLTFFISVSAGAQIKRCSTCSGGGSTVDTTPLHNQIVANSTALAGKLSSQVGTIANPNWHIWFNGDSYMNPGAFASDTSKDFTHLIASFMGATRHSIAVNGQKLQGNTTVSQIPVYNSSMLVFITQLGLNDLFHQDVCDSATYRATLNSYIDTCIIARGWPASKLVFGSVPFQTPTQKVGTVGYSNAMHMAYNQIIQQVCAQRGCVFVDVYTYQLNHGGEAQLWSDSIHINDLGHRNEAMAYLGVLTPHTYNNGNQQLAVDSLVEFRTIVEHPNKIPTDTLQKAVALGVLPGGTHVLMPDVLTVSSPNVGRNSGGSLRLTGWMTAGDYPWPTDQIGRALFRGGTNTDFLTVSTNTWNPTGGYPIPSGNTLQRPGLRIYMADSSDVYFDAKNYRNTSAPVNMVFSLGSTSHMLFGGNQVPAEGSMFYFGGQTKVTSLYLGSGASSYIGIMTPGTNTIMMDAYNGSANKSINFNWHGGGTCFNCGYDVANAASSVVEIKSTTQGFLPPRMTNAQRTAIASPAVGLVVYCTDTTEGLYVYTSAGWKMATLQ